MTPEICANCGHARSSHRKDEYGLKRICPIKENEPCKKFTLKNQSPDQTKKPLGELVSRASSGDDNAYYNKGFLEGYEYGKRENQSQQKDCNFLANSNADAPKGLRGKRDSFCYWKGYEDAIKNHTPETKPIKSLKPLNPDVESFDGNSIYTVQDKTRDTLRGSLSDKRELIRKELLKLHEKTLQKKFISLGDFLRIRDLVIEQDKEAVKKLVESIPKECSWISETGYGVTNVHKKIEEIFGGELVK